MRSSINKNLRPSWVIFLGLVILLFLPTFPLSAEEETYVFERMWPELQQPWYFYNAVGIALDQSDNFYVVDSHYHRIQKFSPSGEFITKWGSQGGDDGQFFFPAGIAVDASGNVYVVDTGNCRIQKFSPSGEFITKWGSEGSGDGEFRFYGYNGDTASQGNHGIAIDSVGNVYLADTSNNRIQKFTSDGVFISKWGTEGSGDGEFNYPLGLAIDKNNNLYVVDSNNFRIQKFDLNGNFITTWGSKGTGDGQFEVCNHPAFMGEGPQGIAIDKNGYVYVADRGNERIQVFTPDAVFIRDFNAESHGLAITETGYIYTGDFAISKFTTEGEYITQWRSDRNGDGEFVRPTGITADTNGNICVADGGIYGGRIQKFTSEGEFIGKWGGYGTGDGELKNPTGITIDAGGFVYVVDSLNYRIQKFNPNGNFIKMWGSPGTGDGEFGTTDSWDYGEGPCGIAGYGSDYIYVIDKGNNRIQKFTSDGEYLTQWGTEGSEDGQFIDPTGVAVDGDGNVYVADQGNNRVQKFSSNGEFLSKWANYSPWGIAVDEDGYVYVSYGNNIRKYTPNGELVTMFGEYGTDPGQFISTRFFYVNKNGKIYLTDDGPNRVQVFAPESLINDPADAPDEDPETIPKAIIVAGGGPFQGNNLWEATQMCANYAYRALTYQGYTKNSIYYLSADTDLDLDGNGILDDVDGDATNGNLQTAITTWAQDAEDLFIYMVDHGGEGTFRMGATELLYAQDLDSWLDEIQDTIPGSVTLLYDACQSGSFLPLLTPPSGKERIIAASASSNEEALFGSQGTISFSFLFWARMFNGDSFYDSFVNAKNSVGMSYAQTSQIEANGNGVGNEDEDKVIAEALKIGNETLSAGDIPVIGSVSPEQTLEGETSALIYAEDVIDANGISRVWAVITPPGYSPGSLDSPVTDLPVLDLGIVGDNCYEGTYDGFTEEGSYSIAIYASDGYGVISFPMPTEVNQTEGFSAWQLISLSQQPLDTNIDAVLDTISDKVISVWAYMDSSWQVYDPENPGFSDLETMGAGKGYWLHLNEPATLDISGTTASGSINLSTGWNLVGYNSETAQNIADALASIEDKYISVWAYMDGGWKVYNPENPGFSDLTTMEPGYGYWINASEGCTWILP
jgi:sugar lactone lactonase YvrE